MRHKVLYIQDGEILQKQTTINKRNYIANNLKEGKFN